MMIDCPCPNDPLVGNNIIMDRQIRLSINRSNYKIANRFLFSKSLFVLFVLINDNETAVETQFFLLIESIIPV